MNLTMRGMRHPAGLSPQWQVFVNRLPLVERVEFEEYAAFLEFEQDVEADQADYLAAEWILLLKRELSGALQHEESDHERIERRRASLRDAAPFCCDRPIGECECAR